MSTSPRLPSSRWLAVRQNRSAPMVTVTVCPLRRLGICRRTTVTIGISSELIYEFSAHAAMRHTHGSPGDRPVDSLAGMDHVLTTERLVLRPVTAADHGVLLAHWTLPAVRRFLFDDALMPADELAETIADSVRDFAAGGYGI